MVTIGELSRDEVDRLRSAAPPELVAGFQRAFDTEENSLQQGKRWSLPSSERTYFIASLHGAPYLLAGINPSPPTAINISSFARIVETPKGYAADCLKKLIEARFVPMCREAGKAVIFVRTKTEGGKKVLAILQANLPMGITAITTRDGRVWTLLVAA